MPSWHKNSEQSWGQPGVKVSYASDLSASEYCEPRHRAASVTTITVRQPPNPSMSICSLTQLLGRVLDDGVRRICYHGVDALGSALQEPFERVRSKNTVVIAVRHTCVYFARAKELRISVKTRCRAALRGLSFAPFSTARTYSTA